jgi:Leucine-rich repeat (LRR) protein
MTALQQLKLNRCTISGQLPAALGNLTNLEVVDVSFNALIGAVPPSVSALVKLKTFDISFNGFAMSAQALLQVLIPQLQNPKPVIILLQPLQNLPQLSYVSFSSNHISGQLSTDLFWNLDSTIIYFPSLTSLTLSNNSVTGTLLHVMGALPMLSTIDVSSNNLIGSIPSSFNSLSVLIAANNTLHDTADALPPFLEPQCDTPCLATCNAAANASTNYLVASCLRSCCDVVQTTDSNIVCPDIRFKDNHRKVAKLDPSYSSFSTCTCAPGFFGSPPLCQPCLKNALCDGSK